MKKSKRLGKNYLKFVINKAIYLVGVFGFAVYIPQLVKVWVEKTVSGLSLITWLGITLGSIIWLLYGIVNKQKPIIIINLMLTLIQFSIAAGIYFYR